MRFISALLITAFLQSTEGLRCFSCTGVLNPAACEKELECADDEECFVERIVGHVNKVFYNAGCRKLKVCKFLALVHPKRADLAICQECCGYNLCNKAICTQNASSVVECYQCGGVQSPAECHNRVTCQHDQMCFSTEYLTDFLEVKYRLGCESKARCTLLNINRTRREIPFCSECCPINGCNRHLCDYPGNTCFSFAPSDNTTTTPEVLDSSTTSTTVSPSTGTTNSADSTTPAASVGTTSPGPCDDNVEVDCKALNDIVDICSPVTEQTRTMCPRFCGLCDITDSIVRTTTSTAPVPCVDSHLVNCTDIHSMANVCHPVTQISRRLCPKFCGLCVPHPTTEVPLSTNPIQQSTSPVQQSTKPAPQSTQTAPQSTQTAPQSTQTAPQSTQSTQTAPQSTKTVPQSTKQAPQSTQTAPQSTQTAPQSTKVVHLTTLAVTQSTKPIAALCFQCGDRATDRACSMQEVVLGSPSQCEQGYCMTDVYVRSDGVNYDVYKRCVSHAICKMEWFEESSDNDECTNLESRGLVADLVCHFCCRGDGCNSNLVPPLDLLYNDS